MARIKDPDTQLRIALRADELHHQGNTVEEIISTILSEKFVRKNGTNPNRHQILSAMYNLCGWYVPSKGKLRQAREGLAPAHGHHRKRMTRKYTRQRQPPNVVIPNEWKILGAGLVAIALVVAAFLVLRG